MAVSELRNLGYCVEFRVYCIMRCMNWVSPQVNVSLGLVSGTTYQPIINEAGIIRPFMPQKGFCWLAPMTNPDDSPITTAANVSVFANGVLIDPSTYTVDFRTPLITFNSSVPAGTLTLNALFWSCRVTNGYPLPAQLELMELPSIAWGIDSQDGRPYAIGTSLQFRTRYLTLDLMARNNGEQADMIEDFQRYFSRTSYIDMTTHQPLTVAGSIDPSFSFDDQFIMVIPQMRKPRGSLLPPKQGGSVKERYRGLVSVEMEMVS
jgi:hypothetical protein